MTTPRLLTRPEAATYCGVAPSTFSLWVTTGKMPPAVQGTRRWDKAAIDDKLDALRGVAANDNDPYTEWMKQNAGSA